MLDRVRQAGDWERWLAYFLDGVRETAQGAVSTSVRLSQMFESDRSRVQQTGRRTASALQVYQTIKEHPILSLSDAAEITGLSFRTTSAVMEMLLELDIVREITRPAPQPPLRLRSVPVHPQRGH
jgi:Fic family protein